MIRFLQDREIYTEVIQGIVPEARSQLWIGTATLKDLHVDAGRGRMVPFLQTLEDLLERGVEVRLIHAAEPGPVFREEFDRYPLVSTRMERMLCPRVHFKTIIVDCRMAYLGSANLTGAGMGAKSDHRRNFENGILTDEPTLVDGVAGQFDRIWCGEICETCGRREYCGDCPLD